MEELAGQIVAGLAIAYAFFRHYLIARTHGRILCICGHRFDRHEDPCTPCNRGPCTQCECAIFVVLPQAQLIERQLALPAPPALLVTHVYAHGQGVRTQRSLPTPCPAAASCLTCTGGCIKLRLPPAPKGDS